MAVTIQPLYAADVAIVATNWESLAAGAWATLPAVDNTSNRYGDFAVGGQIDLDTATGALAAGESFNIYAAAQFDYDVASSYEGGIDTGFTANDSSLTEDTEFNPLNMKLIYNVMVRDTAPDTTLGYNWMVESLAAYFKGRIPKRWILIGHNNTGGTTKVATSTTIINYTGIHDEIVTA